MQVKTEDEARAEYFNEIRKRGIDDIHAEDQVVHGAWIKANANLMSVRAKLGELQKMVANHQALEQRMIGRAEACADLLWEARQERTGGRAGIEVHTGASEGTVPGLPSGGKEGGPSGDTADAVDSEPKAAKEAA